MPDGTRSINPEWTVASFAEMLEGSEFNPTNPNKNHFECDFCSKGVMYQSEPRVASYFADNILNTDHPIWQQHGDRRPMVALATYCEDCTYPLLYFPCEGFAEVRVISDLDADRTMHNVDVEDVSARDDGIPWDPKEFVHRVTGTPFEDSMLIQSLHSRDHVWGPENMVTVFLSIGSGIDLREIIKHDGSLDDRKLGQARKEQEKFRKKMARHGHSRLAFRKHVRGE